MVVVAQKGVYVISEEGNTHGNPSVTFENTPDERTQCLRTWTKTILRLLLRIEVMTLHKWLQKCVRRSLDCLFVHNWLKKKLLHKRIMKFEVCSSLRNDLHCTTDKERDTSFSYFSIFTWTVIWRGARIRLIVKYLLSLTQIYTWRCYLYNVISYRRALRGGKGVGFLM